MVLDEFGVKNTDNLTVRILTGKQKDTNFQKETNESLDDTNSSTSKTDVTPVMNKIKVIGNPSDKSDFWFYTEEITDDDGNPTVFHAQEGTGDNLDIEDEEKGFVDYIYYDTYDGEINYSMINNYISGDDYDTLDDFESDGGMILLYNPYTKLTVKQICWHILDMSGVSNPENLTVRILSGNKADDKFKKAEATESLDDTDASGTKTDVTPMMNKIKVIGNPVDKSDFLFYCREIIGEGGNPIVFWVHEGTGDNLDDEHEEQGFNDYIYYTIYEGVEYSTIDTFIYGDYEVLDQFEGDSDFVYLYNNYRDLTVQQICWKILKNYGEDAPEKLTVRILEEKTAVDDFKKDAQKYKTGPITKELGCDIHYIDSNNDWWPIKGAENIKTKSEAIEFLIKKYGKDCKDTFSIITFENKYRNGKYVNSEEIDNYRGTIAELSSRIKKSAQNESLIDDESHNIELSSDKAAKFIKESVEWLLQEEMGCCTKELTPEVQLAVGWLNGYDPEDTTLIHSKEDPTWCICVGIVAADGDDMKTDLEWLTIPYVADGENEGDVFSELMEPLSPNDNYAKVFKYLAKEYEGILKEYDVHSDGKCFHKKGNATMEESIKPKKGKGGLTFREKCRAAQRGFKYSPDMDTLIYEDDNIVIASDEDHIPSWDVLDSGDYDLYGREVTDDAIYLDDDGNPIMMSSILYDGPWEKFTIRDGHVVGREPTDEQPA